MNRGFSAIGIEPDGLRLGPDQVLPLRQDLATGLAEVDLDGRSWRLRPLRFGERRRALLAAAADGSIDLDRLVGIAASALVEPTPEPEHVELLGLAALAWSALAGAPRPPPPPGLTAAAQLLALARATGWSWQEIDQAPAAEVDRWYAALVPAAMQTAVDADGYTRFLFEEER
jgi:hypothetical protein